jgi:serine protease inhibitor
MDTRATIRSDFATRLYDKLAGTQEGKNLFLSPFSIRDRKTNAVLFSGRVLDPR